MRLKGKQLDGFNAALREGNQQKAIAELQMACARAEGTVPFASASGSTADRDIRCRNCSKLFDVMKAEVGDRTLENTLTGLKDLNNPWVKCPHCGVTM